MIAGVADADTASAVARSRSAGTEPRSPSKRGPVERTRRARLCPSITQARSSGAASRLERGGVACRREAGQGLVRAGATKSTSRQDVAREQHGGGGVGDDVCELGGAVARVDGDDDARRASDAEHRVARTPCSSASRSRRGRRGRTPSACRPRAMRSAPLEQLARRRPGPSVKAIAVFSGRRCAAATTRSPNVVTCDRAACSCRPPRVVALAERVHGRAGSDGIPRQREAGRRSARPRPPATCPERPGTPATIASNGRDRTSFEWTCRVVASPPPCRRRRCSPRARSRARRAARGGR